MSSERWVPASPERSAGSDRAGRIYLADRGPVAIEAQLAELEGWARDVLGDLEPPEPDPDLPVLFTAAQWRALHVANWALAVERDQVVGYPPHSPPWYAARVLRRVRETRDALAAGDAVRAAAAHGEAVRLALLADRGKTREPIPHEGRRIGRLRAAVERPQYVERDRELRAEADALRREIEERRTEPSSAQRWTANRIASEAMRRLRERRPDLAALLDITPETAANIVARRP
jgi:hypothetical protein